jgi:HEAT repeat protein
MGRQEGGPSRKVLAMKHHLHVAVIVAVTCALVPGASLSEMAFATLDSALRSKNPDTRKDAVKALGVLGSMQPYQARLESMLHDNDMEVRLAVVASLAETANAPALEQALDDRTPEVRFAAAKALFAMHDPAGKPALIRVLNGRDKTSSSLIAEQKREALRLLHTPQPLLIIALRQGVGFVPVPYFGTGVSVMEKVISRSGAPSRATTALLLRAEQDPEVMAALESALKDKDAAVRGAAILAIAGSNDPALVKDAGDLLNDRSRTVRVRAAACYLRLTLAVSVETGEPSQE